MLVHVTLSLARADAGDLDAISGDALADAARVEGVVEEWAEFSHRPGERFLDFLDVMQSAGPSLPQHAPQSRLLCACCRCVGRI